MLEIFHFINPLQMESMTAEKHLLTKTAALKTKTNYKFIPMNNLQVVNSYFATSDQEASLANRNKIAQLLYQISTDYEAMAFQGQRKARQFLLALQTALLVNQQPYSSALVIGIADDLNTDVAMFQEDRSAPATAQIVRANQQLATEMGVASTPSAILFDYDRFDYGLIIDDFDEVRLAEFFNEHSLQPREKIARPNILRVVGR
ncbi:hypothetical protein EQG49_01920 [Periweissella cryptocerci]|uniref:Dithiol-disulfide isomerase n=1 Tax=Periweissella cryptocerci TaxID=2506420 RepID=A0A4P6YRQ3_9LACO|nr:DsbA family protein [Periweissella cryptocerci]QBO35306.1 hypothetical protein EQG49_01920 [Periweissella cryptocerci]